MAKAVTTETQQRTTSPGIGWKLKVKREEELSQATQPIETVAGRKFFFRTCSKKF